MAVIESTIAPSSAAYKANRDGMLALIARMRALEERARAASALAKDRFHKRGQLLPRERVALVLDPGTPFIELSRLSAAGLPVVTVTHGSSTAGGAYQTGLSDYIVMVRGRTRAFLAGPPLLKAATGEIATEEELGGAEMHTSISGLGDYLAEDDRDALRIARDIMANLEWDRPAAISAAHRPPRHDPEELLGIMAMDHKRPVDMRQVIAVSY